MHHSSLSSFPLPAAEFLSEELLGKLESLLLSSVVPLPAAAEGEDQGYWAAAALAAAFAPPHLDQSEHPLLIYKQYINRYERVAESLNELLEVGSFAARTRKVASSLHSQHNLHDLFIMPVQRLPRYMLLLEAAAAAMPPSDPGAAALKRAVEAVRGVVSGGWPCS